VSIRQGNLYNTSLFLSECLLRVRLLQHAHSSCDNTQQLFVPLWTVLHVQQELWSSLLDPCFQANQQNCFDEFGVTDLRGALHCWSSTRYEQQFKNVPLLTVGT